MSEPFAADFEGLLRQALAPGRAARAAWPSAWRRRWQTLTELAAEELEAWELGAMRDPRNWVRPVVAVAVGTAAGAGLVVLRVRSQHRKQRKHVHGRSTSPSARCAPRADEVRRLLDRR